jgi:hypothetical protein
MAERRIGLTRRILPGLANVLYLQSVSRFFRESWRPFPRHYRLERFRQEHPAAIWAAGINRLEEVLIGCRGAYRSAMTSVWIPPV